MALRRPALLHLRRVSNHTPYPDFAALNPGYSVLPCSSFLATRPFYCMARPAGFEPATLGLAYQLRLSTPQYLDWVCGLDYLFTITGVARIVSTEPIDNQRPTLRFLTDYYEALLPSR